MRVLIAESWYRGSHRAWADGLAGALRGLGDHCDVVGLTGDGWRWRMRASAPALAEQIRALESEPDVAVVSGMTDVAALRGLAGLQCPIVTYMHETQFVYPLARGGFDVESAAIHTGSWRASDEVWFNSEHHRRTVIDALPQYLDRLPADLGLPADPLAQSVVMPVGVDLSWVVKLVHRRPGPTRILWPHRWDLDKNPAAFCRAMNAVLDAGVPCEVILAGEVGHGALDERQALIDRMGAQVTVGPFDRAEYHKQLHLADLVVSCAEHEFFGVAVVEALASGCVPVLPHALSYPEIVSEVFQDCLYEPGSFGAALEAATRDRRVGPGLSELAPTMLRYSWDNVGPRYRARIEHLAKR